MTTFPSIARIALAVKTKIGTTSAFTTPIVKFSVAHKEVATW
jgi:hypothetical protein